MQNIAVSLLYFDILLYHYARKMTMQLAIKFSNRFFKKEHPAAGECLLRGDVLYYV